LFQGSGIVSTTVRQDLSGEVVATSLWLFVEHLLHVSCGNIFWQVDTIHMALPDGAQDETILLVVVRNGKLFYAVVLD
jgi:hypothetical protein